MLVVAVCRAFPDPSPSNAALVSALREEGAEVAALSWNDAPMAAFAAAQAVLLRQTWDYILDPGGYAAWACRAEALGARLVNRAGLAVWNNDKRCIVEMGAAGLAVPETVDLAAAADPAAAVAALGDRAVLKRAFGGGGHGVRLTGPATAADDLAALAAEAPGQPLMAQAFCPEIAAGEWSMVFIAGTLSHTVIRRPAPGEFRVNNRFGPLVALADAPAAAVSAGRAILDWLGEPVTVARIDGVMRGDAFVCTELELTDPDLSLDLAPGSAGRLARAVLDSLG